MLTFAAKYGYNITSQNGEDGIIKECIKRIKPESLMAVEFGAPTKSYCSNIYSLPESWQKIWLDIDPNESGIQKVTITPQNINDLFDLPTILSIDIDNDDYHVWKAYKGNPEIIIIEINSGIDPVIGMIPGDSGASYRSMVQLGLSKGYFLLCHTGNLIFVLNKFMDLFPEIDGDPLIQHHLFFNKSFL